MTPKPELIADYKSPGAGIMRGGSVAPPTCQDCGRHHDTVWAAFACDDFTDAHRRRAAGRAARRLARREDDAR